MSERSRSERGAALVLEVLFLDDDLAVVAKPAGMPSVPGRNTPPSAIELLSQRPELSGQGGLRVVHRLDRGASGVLVFARTLAAQRGLVQQFMQHRIEKVYTALVSGYVAEDGEIDLPLYFNSRLQRAEVNHSKGKPSLTRYHIVERLAGHTVLECRPITGRMHQIRAHLAAIGHPLGVDPTYGGRESILLSEFKPDYRVNRSGQERPLIERLTLHAARISFEHPISGAAISCEAPLPKDMRATIRQLARLA
jgi:23S rRNA pseudouridine1911/1915/1917 synthase